MLLDLPDLVIEQIIALLPDRNIERLIGPNPNLDPKLNKLKRRAIACLKKRYNSTNLYVITEKDFWGKRFCCL
ncbi:MAG: hypothetical protein NQ127_00470 [Candidatus Cardinium sp.]|nr:hypothetical protein [Candidatus Cardinium sp.]